MVNKNKINSIYDHLKSSLEELRDIAKTDKDAFFQDGAKIGAAKYYLQTSIEACIDLGHHIISAEDYRSPQNLRDIFKVLSENGVLPKDFSETMQYMAGFRNRLVHLYWEVDNEELYKYLQNQLGDFDTYVHHILDFVEKQGESDEQE
jgi:uncharacterized protein YutE (UPF0331/DUF86 family)